MTSLESSLAPESLRPGFISGYGPTMRSLNAMVAEVAPTGIPILIMGECGTGKDTYARLIHYLSYKTGATFRRIDCAGAELADFLNQLNGKSVKRRSEEEGRTFYLDGIQDLDLHCQRVLLSHLCVDEDQEENRGLRRRVISSTNTSLEQEVESGRFRRELYFRINGACIHLPPLRERREDIPDLLEYFLRKHKSGKNATIPPLSGDARELLLAYSWPGNIRQLENVALKILTLGEARALAELELIQNANLSPEQNTGLQSLKTAVRAASQKTERELIIQALERTRWNRKRAAQELRISYKSFLNKLKAIETSPGGAVHLKEGK